MLSEILKAAGYRTGLYISPHVVEFTERMQLNGEEIPRRSWSPWWRNIFLWFFPAGRGLRYYGI